MGKGNRGFKPQGIVNPILLARLNKPVQTGPTIRERLERDNRPSWADVKEIVNKKEKSSSDYLEKWENENYRAELSAIRHKRRGAQEKQYLKELSQKRKELRRRQGSSSSSSSYETSSSHNGRSERHRRRSFSSNSDSSLDRRNKSKKRKKLKKEKDPPIENNNNQAFHPHKLSVLLKTGHRRS